MRFALFVFGLTAATACAQEAMPLDALAKLKQATSYVRTDFDPQENQPARSGSGFVIKTDGTTGYIVTNAHVINAPGQRTSYMRSSTARVFFRSGTNAETDA